MGIRAPISDYIKPASACLVLHLAVRPAHAKSETPETRDAHRIPNICAGDSCVEESKNTQIVYNGTMTGRGTSVARKRDRKT